MPSRGVVPAAAKRQYPLDRWAVLVMAALTPGHQRADFFLETMPLRGCETFSWQHRQVGAEDKAFFADLSVALWIQPVLKDNLTIVPAIPGKVSWAGRRMAYTLEAPLPYGESFSVTLGQAKDRFSAEDDQPSQFEAFQGRFQTRKRAFLYIGSEQEEKDRLVFS